MKYIQSSTAALCASLSLLLITSTHAATVLWQGGNGLWSDQNWSIQGGVNQPLSQTIKDRISISSGSVTTNSRIIAGATGSLSENRLRVHNNATLTSTSDLYFGARDSRKLTFVMRDNAQVTVTALTLRTAQPTLSSLIFAGGTLTLTASNPITGSDFANQSLNITADAGQFHLLHTDTSNADKTLAVKVSKGLFSIHGTKITASSDGKDLALLNAELATQIVKQKYLQITQSGGTQTLAVVAAVPEPSSLALLGVAAITLTTRRRRF
jgi:hypothetical protein